MSATDLLFDFFMRNAFYAALAAILMMIIALIIKLMCHIEATGVSPAPSTERSRLIPWKESKESVKNYGSLESGSSCSSEEGVYNGRMCVICYERNRDCFYIPCGHCISCQACAYRVMKSESKCCPICRGIIHKVRKLHFL